MKCFIIFIFTSMTSVAYSQSVTPLPKKTFNLNTIFSACSGNSVNDPICNYLTETTKVPNEKAEVFYANSSDTTKKMIGVSEGVLMLSQKRLHIPLDQQRALNFKVTPKKNLLIYEYTF